ncbi:MAG: 3-deoxy-manno-octulosonate cytidylyltransferase [Gemmatimonadetes bacterium]|nr:3-deoxy-manno-octulosonate cytidylyltransferase [Gemmatimonadota bacterium]
MPVLGVIPARLGSTRLARKPLQLLGGVPLVVRVLERVHAIRVADEVIVATDAPDIQQAVERAGGRAVLTAASHQSGTDRVAEVARRPDCRRFDVVLNVQGDEPFVSAEAALGAVGRVEQGDQVGTAAVALAEDRAGDPNRVKVVFDGRGRAWYFSRARIPHPGNPEAHPGYWQHVGIYAYRPAALQRWAEAPQSVLERAERLEQLRALELGLSIGVAAVEGEAVAGIDTADDLARAETAWHTLALGEGRQ